MDGISVTDGKLLFDAEFICSAVYGSGMVGMSPCVPTAGMVSACRGTVKPLFSSGTSIALDLGVVETSSSLCLLYWVVP